MERTYEEIVRDMQRIDGLKKQKMEVLNSMDTNDPRQHADIVRMLDYIRQLDAQSSLLFGEYVEWCNNHGMDTKHSTPWFEVKLDEANK